MPSSQPMPLPGRRRLKIYAHAEVVALKGLFEDPLFLADCLQRLLNRHPDLQLLVRHVHEQLVAEGRESPMG